MFTIQLTTRQLEMLSEVLSLTGAEGNNDEWGELIEIIEKYNNQAKAREPLP